MTAAAPVHPGHDDGVTPLVLGYALVHQFDASFLRAICDAVRGLGPETRPFG